MGERKLVDKTAMPQQGVKALQYMTLVQAEQAFNGVWLIGKYKGGVAKLDIDTLIAPLVLAEQLHILGILDGREEDYDLQTIRIPNGAAIGAEVREKLVVPSGEIWYVTAIRLVTPADQGGTPAINWRCSLWPDRAATPDPDGQAFHKDPKSKSTSGDTWYDEFHPFAPSISVFNKPVALRLPAGTVITAIATNLNAAATANMDCTLALKGYVGRALVG